MRQVTISLSCLDLHVHVSTESQHAPYFLKRSCSAIVCACSHRLATAEANPTSNRRGDGDRLEGKGDALGELNGLCVPMGDLGVSGVGGNDGERAPPAAPPRLSRREVNSEACSGRRPPEKSVPGCGETGRCGEDMPGGKKSAKEVILC